MHCAARTFLFAVLSALFPLWTMPATPTSNPVTLVTESDLEAPAEFGLDRLEEALQNRGFKVNRTEVVPTAPEGGVILAGLAVNTDTAARWLRVLEVPVPTGAEALVIRRTRIANHPAVVLCGSDSRGLMYAALEAAGQISAAAPPDDPFLQIRNAEEEPYLKERAVSIYTMHRGWFERRLHDERQWERYFDLLARSRINSFVVIFGYENGGFMAPPYPFFFNVPGFPQVEMVGLNREQQRRNTLDFEKMIRLAHARGIDVVPAIWDHIYRGGVQGGGIAGASDRAGQRVPGLVYGVTSDNLVAYNQAAIRKFLDVFPEIDGLQFRMHGESGLKRSEMQEFWHEIFRSIREKRPDLRVDLRAKQLPDAVIRDGLEQQLHLRVTTKYWMEQMGLPFHPTHVNPPNQHDRRHGYADLLRYPQHYRIHWRLWNGGTTRLLLWGDPEYVRRFASSARLYDGNSFEVNEMMATWMLGEPHDAPPRDILNPAHRYYDYPLERYWHFFQLWGRLTYNPKTPTEVWEREFIRRFGHEAGPHVMLGLHRASRVLPRIVAASYLYRLFPTTRGWAEMMWIGDLPEFARAEGSDVQQFQNPREAAQSLLDGTDTAMRRPADTSRWFADVADDILREVAMAESADSGRWSKEFVSTLADLKILAGLARYHSHRLPAAVNFNLYQETGDLFTLDDAVASEQQAVQAWQDMVTAAGDIYSTNLAFGVHRVGFPRHWQEELTRLRTGLAHLRTEQTHPSLQTGPFAHIPVRRLAPGDALQLRVTHYHLDRAEDMVAHIAEGDGPSHSVEFRRVGPNRYETSFLPAPNARNLKYSIAWIDPKDRRHSIPSNRNAPTFNVIISEDTHPPDIQLERKHLARPGEELQVSARIHDASGVKWARLRYRHLTQFEDYQSAEMHRNPATGLWQATIPGNFILPEWDLMYFLEAVDRAGNGRMTPNLETEMPYVVVRVAR